MAIVSTGCNLIDMLASIDTAQHEHWHILNGDEPADLPYRRQPTSS